MTILLIEDEPLVARQLLKLVSQAEPAARIDGPLGSVASVVDYLGQHRPDLIIADIQLADGVSFDALQQVSLSVPVIFTTAYDEYAIRAFKLNSLDYLLKPIDPDELANALAKYHRWQPTGADFATHFQSFLSQLNAPAQPTFKRRFTAHYLRQIISVPEDRVVCFTRDELIYLYTTDGQKLVTDYRTLDELTDLVDPACFFRANRQFLVSLQAVAGYRPHHTGRIEIMLKKPGDQLELQVSKERAASFRQWFEG